ncbi:MAG: GNAT family N-acetyltransferase [Lachnospiraceae bacterium]|nr:GNAT family N-acetyltransferase [Lachnospiraceae bacterium]
MMALIAFCLYEGKIEIMETFVVPEKRGQGIGSKVLKELLKNGQIIDFVIHKSEAVIYPNNIASQKAFENAGFKYHHTHEDGDAMYYVYESGLEEKDIW